MQILETKNPITSKMTPIKEKQDILVPGIIDQNIPNRNGMITLFCGSGGSGKTSLMLNMMQMKNMYRNKFDNIFYICPMASFLSVEKHPFQDHDKVIHELSVEILETIYQKLVQIRTDKEEKKKTKKKNKKNEFIDEDEELAEKEDPIQYSIIIIDDFADQLKDKRIQSQLNKMLIKSRHLCCSFFFTLQGYLYFPKMLRKQITNIIIFKPKNIEEWNILATELMNLAKTDAIQVFDYIFDEAYNHLDIDTVGNKYYKNFNLLDLKRK